MRAFRKALLAGAAVTALALGAAVPAMADTVPEPMSASVQPFLSISGLGPVTFGSGVPGQVLSFQEQYAVQANTNYVVQVSDIGSPHGLMGPQSTIIPDSAITVTNGTSHTQVTLSPTPQTLFSNGSNNSLVDTWSLTIPQSGAMPGSYSGEVEYDVTGG